MTGFAGSAGTAVVTDTLAALWTDGRYHLQAEQQLDCHWTLMKEGHHQVAFSFFNYDSLPIINDLGGGAHGHRVA